MADGFSVHAIISRPHNKLAAFMNQQELRERLKGAGVEPTLNMPDKFANFLNSETSRYAKMIASSVFRLPHRLGNYV